jgi:hypothetical protein
VGDITSSSTPYPHKMLKEPGGMLEIGQRMMKNCCFTAAAGKFPSRDRLPD